MTRPSKSGVASTGGDEKVHAEREAAETTTRGIGVGAPPWAARAFTQMADGGVLANGVRHVVVGDDPIDEADATGVEVLWRYHLTPTRLERALDELPDLKWVHSDYVGVEELPLRELGKRGILLSNGAGIAARPMAEWVVLAVLAAAKQLPRFVRQSDARTWEVGEPLAELEGAVVLIVGLGAVGTMAAGMLEGFAVEVRGCTRTARSETPRGVTRMVVGDQWRGELADADYVVCAVPLTSETDGMFDAAAFAAMKRGACLINVARGRLVDDEALLAALEHGPIGGAVLDALREEPLPAENPLWGRDDVLVLPHVTWSSTHTLDDFKWRFAAQLQRWRAGETPADLVDLDAGY